MDTFLHNQNVIIVHNKINNNSPASFNIQDHNQISWLSQKKMFLQFLEQGYKQHLYKAFGCCDS